ncbi:hypothetical protein M513_11896 [Trichuris suis]|uniref:Uncharacterized protein n=1 Tax=Trichuris suis TaxID=68888 RepID=A0A085LQE3_9BILA|nr:hypothetical protein M513_11896 [Trichuris suis]
MYCTTFYTTAATMLFGLAWLGFFVADALYLRRFSMFSKDDKDRASKNCCAQEATDGKVNILNKIKGTSSMFTSSCLFMVTPQQNSESRQTWYGSIVRCSN